MISQKNIEAIKTMMTEGGWKFDRDDDENLGFSFYEDEDHEWIRDYSKKNRIICPL